MAHIKLQCNKCSRIHQIDREDFSYDQVDSNEGSEEKMGAAITFEADIEVRCDCGNFIEVIHRYWEYPVGAKDYSETEVKGASTLESML